MLRKVFSLPTGHLIKLEKNLSKPDIWKEILGEENLTKLNIKIKMAITKNYRKLQFTTQNYILQIQMRLLELIG